MPPKTRTKVAKDLKENIDKNVHKTTLKKDGKITKVSRKPLSDKTNSASDENETMDVKKNIPIRPKKLASNSKSQIDNLLRPRRERRLPSRFIDNQVLGNISIQDSTICSKKITHETVKIVPDKTLDAIKRNSSVKSPLDKDKSFSDNRPKRIQRLPAKFDDHSISPNKFIPLQPCFASTPIANKNKVKDQTITSTNKTSEKKQNLVKIQTSKTGNVLKNQDTNNSSDNNNNAQCKRIMRTRKLNNAIKNKSPQNSFENKSLNKKGISPQKPITNAKRLLNLNYSFKVLEEKVSSPKEVKEKLAVYDFTYDPTEEPPPQKKKRKRTARKKTAPKPKITVFKNNYDANISKTLQNLKKAVTKSTNAGDKETGGILENTQKIPEPVLTVNASSGITLTDKTDERGDVGNIVEDFNDHTNYSPITSPNHTPRPQVKISAINETRDQLYARARSTMTQENQQKDPLNLLDELSFCDEVPVACSSMNTSVRHPMASPWRVEFTNLPIKWQDNTYVKPNMTPAVESSFINSLEQKKKHVYTNMVAETNEILPEIVTNDNDTCRWKQTSIISFIREAAERSANKKLKKTTPKKASISEKTNSNDSVLNKITTPTPETSNSSKNITNEKENSGENQTPVKRKGDALENEVPSKSLHIEKTRDQFFGFDDSEDQENVSPKKKDNHRGRTLRPRARAVLKEINKISGPSRAQLPPKTKFAPNSEIVDKLFNEIKSSTEAPVLPATETIAEKEAEVSNISDPSWHESMEERNDEAQSVHLFEDIDVVHHLKPQRKSYGNIKKATFCQKTMNTESQLDSHDESDEEDPEDLPFQMPTIKIKKVAPKKKKGIKLTKKEEEEVEAWAAAFNSMCEDVDEFPLVVE